MSVIAEFTIDEEEFAFGSILADVPDVSVELDRITPRGSRGAPYLWVSGDNHEAFEETVRGSSLIRELTAVDRVDDSVLYRVSWEDKTESLLQQIGQTNATIVEAYRENRNWFFRIRFDEHEDLSTFNEHCSRSDIEFRLTRVYPDADRQSRTTAFGLTHQQRDALILALERGYFGIPRGVTLTEIGDELGVSQQAASERVRRAAGKVLRSVLLGPELDPDQPS